MEWIDFILFECDACGLCCQNITGIKQLEKYNRGDGVCINLGENLLCQIYEDRPIICRVDDLYHLIFKDVLSIEEFYLINTNVCNQLKGVGSLLIDSRLQNLNKKVNECLGWLEELE